MLDDGGADEKEKSLEVGEAGGAEEKVRPELINDYECDEPGETEAKTVEGLIAKDVVRREVWDDVMESEVSRNEE